MSNYDEIFKEKRSRQFYKHLIVYLIGPLNTIIFFLLAYLLYEHQEFRKAKIEKDAIQNSRLINNFFQEIVYDHKNALGVSTQSIKFNRSVLKAFADTNRQNLFRLNVDFFNKIKNKFEITHMYFINSDRKCFLRVHQPKRYGDIINRQTAIEAQNTKKPASGIELGPLGTLTLRYVDPVLNERTNYLEGFIELGIEVKHMVEAIEKFMEIDAYVLVEKKYLKKEDWQDGMRMLGRTFNWDIFENHVFNIETKEIKDKHFLKYLKKNIDNTTGLIKTYEHNDIHKKVLMMPIKDLKGNVVARLVGVKDITQEVKQLQNSLYFELSIAGFLFLILLSILYYLIKVVTAKLEESEKKLRDLATLDNLTGIYNNRAFHAFLQDEILRSDRQKTHVSILMIDLDNFKKINDKYGHQTGDFVLVEFAKRVSCEIRNVDRFCRYGGEEFSVILPDTSINNMYITAQRILKKISDEPFETICGQKIYVTTSIGAASYPEQASSEDKLIAAADKALYAAKDSGKNRIIAFNEK
ncbi:MAG: GGDEF domain-containing protein [Spirochaetia bacterium]|nr:GGDEF domain-containing protein [Spirochaetia bacterium]